MYLLIYWLYLMYVWIYNINTVLIVALLVVLGSLLLIFSLGVFCLFIFFDWPAILRSLLCGVKIKLITRKSMSLAFCIQSCFMVRWNTVWARDLKWVTPGMLKTSQRVQYRYAIKAKNRVKHNKSTRRYVTYYIINGLNIGLKTRHSHFYLTNICSIFNNARLK